MLSFKPRVIDGHVAVVLPRHERPLLEGAFQSVEHRMVQLLDYATKVLPIVANEPKLLSELADSVVVLGIPSSAILELLMCDELLQWRRKIPI